MLCSLRRLECLFIFLPMTLFLILMIIYILVLSWWNFSYKWLHFDSGELRQLNELLFKGSSKSPVPKIVGLAEFLTSPIPIISSSFELLFDRYSKIPNLTKSVDVVLIRHNNNTGSPSVSTKGESRFICSLNDESEESLVDTTLFILKMFLLGFIIFLFVRKGKFLHSTTCRNTKYFWAFLFCIFLTFIFIFNFKCTFHLHVFFYIIKLINLWKCILFPIYKKKKKKKKKIIIIIIY